MSNAWSWYVIVGTVLSMLACFWLIVWTNKQRASDEELKDSESHVWDGDLRELNNPLPMWWLWLFIITLIFSGVYLVIYPGLGSFQGTLQWSQTSQYEAEVAAAEATYGPLFARYGQMSVAELVEDPQALGIGSSLFANYCSQCHGSTARGALGFPNLTDNDWLYGGEPEKIQQAIMNGRTGVMPGLGAALGSDQDVAELVSYVRNMADGQDTTSSAHGKYMTFCIACHAADGTGNQVLGAPNLTDDIWLYGSSDNVIREILLNGRTGVMPGHASLIGPDRAKILTAYVYSLSRPDPAGE